MFIPFPALAPPDSGWHLLSALWDARLLYYCVTGIMSYHIIASQITPMKQCQSSYCIAFICPFLSMYLATLWALQGEGPFSAFSTTCPSYSWLSINAQSVLVQHLKALPDFPPCVIFLEELLSHFSCHSKALHIFCLIFSYGPSYLKPLSFSFLLYKAGINTLLIRWLWGLQSVQIMGKSVALRDWHIAGAQ